MDKIKSSIFQSCIFIVLIIGLTKAADEHERILCSTNKNQTGVCDCENISTPPWGLRSININCQSKQLTINTFNWETLPLLTEILDISWNAFLYVPDFESVSLKRLIASHNNVTALDDNNFSKVLKLRELDLSWNSIEVISVNAFSGLHHLKILNLSHNHLRKISFTVFSNVVSLEELNMSWNEYLNETFAVKDVDLFVGLGVTPKLRTLELGHCSLTSLDVTQGTNLTNVHLDWNNLTAVPNLPRGVKYLDMSGNPINVIGQKFFPEMYQLETLLMEDMPVLREIGSYAIYNMPALKKLSFQNSRSLVQFSPEAFGPTRNRNETDFILEELSLRGAAIESLNSSLSSVFRQLKMIDLSGLPLDCDCRLLWLKHLSIETGAQCHEPKILHGSKVSEMNFNETECKHWPGWIAHTMHGLMLVIFLVACSVGFYMLVVRLRPFNRSTRRKVGPTSPYAPITIEPNRAENNF